MRLVEVTRGCCPVPAPWRDVEIQGLCSDSRKAKPGDLFVAMPGAFADGRLYAAQAAVAGAAAVVFELARDRPPPEELRALRVPALPVPDARRALGRLARNFYRLGRSDVQLVGITGTKGKTTTAWLLDAIFRAAGKTSGLFGTVHHRVGDRVVPSSNTTPSCLELHRAIRDLVDLGGTHAVLEVSSHGIDQRRIEGLPFAAGIFTNIAPEHLDYHKTFEKYLATKARFFEELDPAAFAVLSREDPASRRIASATPARVAWYGADGQDGVEDVRAGPDGMVFEWRGLEVRSRLWGHHNLLNVLAAMACAECLGFPRDAIAAGIETARPPPGRLEPVQHRGPFRVFVDYAHTEGSLEAVLRTLREITRGRLITIFGCGGDRDRTKRPRMGRVAEVWSDQVIVTSDNPRSEDPERIIEEIASGMERRGDAVFVPDRREAIALGIRMARESDTVLVAGKGHEDTQEIRGTKIPFDDRQVAREYLAERGLIEGP